MDESILKWLCLLLLLLFYISKLQARAFYIVGLLFISVKFLYISLRQVNKILCANSVRSTGHLELIRNIFPEGRKAFLYSLLTGY